MCFNFHCLNYFALDCLSFSVGSFRKVLSGKVRLLVELVMVMWRMSFLRSVHPEARGQVSLRCGGVG